jgi:DNA-binding Xre family transcriptional regulator
MMFENFKMRFPYIAEKCVSYKLTSNHDISIKLEDGDIFLYDDIDCSVRRLPLDSDNLTEYECRKEFSDRLYKMMSRRGITQSQLSEMTGITQTQISKYVNCKSTPSFYTADRIAKALGCSVDYFRYIE